MSRWLALGAFVPVLALAAVGDLVPLANPGFEKVGAGGVDGYAKAGFQPGVGDENLVGLPDGWSAYQWGPNGANFTVGAERGAGREGSIGLRCRNLDPTAQAGMYCHPKLEPGRYRLSVWARAATGSTSKVRIYLCNLYTRPLKITDQWTQVSVETMVTKPVARAEVNVQNCSGAADTVWFDDVELRQIEAVRYRLAPDTRPERPRTLLFSPMNITYLKETAADWARRGFRGFLFDAVMSSWESDVWAADGQPATRGEDDALLAELRACNEACAKVGIDSNVVKVAFYQELPDPFDDAAYAKLTANFREGAKFARLSGCVGMAIDTEYVAQQYQPNWAGYAKTPRPLPELKAQLRERWRTVASAMLAEFPQMVLLTLPEGQLYYGELYTDVLLGLIEACAAANASGGFHIMTEGTYHLTDVAGLAGFPKQVEDALAEALPGPLLDWWRQHGTVVMGAWPLGYYRSLNDADGKFLGYSGRQETFGDKVVGSYADKSAWYPPATFAEQMAGLNTFCPRYNWVYGHGAVFWQWTEEQKARYAAGPHKAAGNATLPVAPDLDAYFAVLAKPQRVEKE